MGGRIPVVAGLISLPLSTLKLIEAGTLLGPRLQIVRFSALLDRSHDQRLKLLRESIYCECVFELPLLHLLRLEVRVVFAHFVHKLEPDSICIVPRKVQT